jgi:hypothetical protein
MPNVQDEPRPWLARLVLLGARGVTAMVVGSGALFGTGGTWLSGASETRLAKAILGTEMIETERRTTTNRQRCTTNFENP